MSQEPPARGKDRTNRVEFFSGRVLYPAIVVLLVITLVGVFGAGPMRRFLAGGQSLRGDGAPDFSLEIAAGGGGASRLRLSDLRGKIVLLDFWATWCPPCRGQMPVLTRFAREQRARVTVVGINVEPGLAVGAVARTAREWRGDYLQLHDMGEVALAYHVESLPTLVVVDAAGRIAAVHRGAASPAELRRLVESAAAR